MGDERELLDTAASLAERLDRLVGMFERILDRRYLEEHDSMKEDTLHLRHAVDELSSKVQQIEEAQTAAAALNTSDLKAKIREYEEGGNYWVRYVVGALVTLALAAGSGVVGYLAHRP